jgi:cytochrome P450
MLAPKIRPSLPTYTLKMYITEFPQSASSSRGWFARIVLLCGVSLLFVFLFIVFRGIHNIFFHPLHKYPGPWLWIAFPTFRHIASVRGYLDGDLRRLHDKYGTVVRFSATELSFITAQAWRDIYGHGHQELPRSLGNGVPDILGGNVAVHARHRKALSHGFSEKALAKQEPLIIYYVNLLLEKLRDVAASGQKTDIVQWYTLTAFDMIGDLSFGASFEGLKNNQVHGWIKMIFQGIKMNVLIQIAQKYPMITKSVMKYMLVADLVQAQQAFVRETAMRKINNPGMAGRGDFMEAMQRHKGGPDGLSMDETVSNLTILIAAGSETTSSLLSGTTHLLLKNPHCMRRVTDEVRGAFEKEDDINFVNASSRLPYMLACLDEALRLYPPIPTGMQRIVPPGASVEISGHDIPPMVSRSSSEVACTLKQSSHALAYLTSIR